MKYLSLLLLPSIIPSVTAFTTHRVPTTTRQTQHVRPLQALSPEHLTELSTALSQQADWLSSHLLADAAAAAAADDGGGGWWQSYLNIFKNTLLAVHNTIDQPLKSVGLEQTWGVSIAIFTASTLKLMAYLNVCSVNLHLCCDSPCSILHLILILP
jgi:hypothetical protein